MTALVKKTVETKKTDKVATHAISKVRSDKRVSATGTTRKVSTSKSTPALRSSATLVRDLPFTEIYPAQPSDRIKFIKDGVPADYVVRISKSMGITRESLFNVLGLPKSTIERKITHNQVLPPDQGERILGLAKLVGQVQVMVEQSGDPRGFDAAEWVASWITAPSPALGGDTPASYMDTSEGQELVSGLIAKMQSGAYA